MMEPRIEGLLDRAGSKFSLVALASMRARQINDYYGETGRQKPNLVPPQVTSSASKSLSIAFEEISQDKVLGVDPETVEAPAFPESDDESDASA
ncbi:UNVERIFIED_CONTAM: hypothetical protein GTU68_026624 [Idotea baltica]|nr:hypothetical protein [Idotea baltica]